MGRYVFLSSILEYLDKMISLNAAHARVRRQKIEEFSGEYYIPPEAVLDVMPFLNEYKEQQFLFGIYESEQKWTVLSVNFLFSKNGNEISTLRLDTGTSEVFSFFQANDFASDIRLKGGRELWFMSQELSSLILNIMLMLQKVSCGTRLV